jgi:hypothetical protein
MVKIRYYFHRFLWWFAFLAPGFFLVVTLILGLMTPGYDPLGHTISRLSTGKYALHQSINFLLLSLGFVATGFVFSRTLAYAAGRRVWKTIFAFCAVICVLLALFPTDSADNIITHWNTISTSARIHILLVYIMFGLMPVGLWKLLASMKSEPTLRPLINKTAILGYLIWLLCLVWSVFYLNDWFTSYRGIFQKGNALLAVYWFMSLLWSVKTAYFTRRSTG